MAANLLELPESILARIFEFACGCKGDRTVLQNIVLVFPHVDKTKYIPNVRFCKEVKQRKYKYVFPIDEEGRGFRKEDEKVIAKKRGYKLLSYVYMYPDGTIYNKRAGVGLFKLNMCRVINEPKNVILSQKILYREPKPIVNDGKDKLSKKDTGRKRPKQESKPISHKQALLKILKKMK